jgi:NAD-dependent dihydropyrimidine dehydrogenase PreA subunit
MVEKKKTKMILVGKDLIGLVALDEVFEKLYQMGKKPGDLLKEELLSEVKKHNYIPPKTDKEYDKALLREYRIFYEKKEKGEKVEKKEVEETYQGEPRENIPWFPTVHEEKCNGCKECYDMCPTHVFIWDEETDKPKLAYPLRCVVGCSGCAEICKLKAISFPPRSIINDIQKRR